MDTFELFEDTRKKGLQIHMKTWVIFTDALHKGNCQEKAAIVGTVPHIHLIEFGHKVVLLLFR